MVDSADVARRRSPGHAQQDRHLWFASGTFCMSSQKPDMREIPKPMLNRFMESLTYAA